MCLLLFALQSHSHYKLIVAANRDEFYNRPTAPAQWWKESPFLLAGQDVKEGGTWMGITRQGKFAAITNYRDDTPRNEDSPSRGFIVKDYLTENLATLDFLKKLERSASKFNGFNLVIGDINQIYFYSNRQEKIELLSPGLYGLSNGLLNTPWFKVTKGREKLRQILTRDGMLTRENLLDLLQDRAMAPEDRLPKTGVSKEWEKILSPIFIASPLYGTRSSTVLMVDRENQVLFVEITHKTQSLVSHSFRIQD
jgi:uncharacterized protein with NRDE domain